MMGVGTTRPSCASDMELVAFGVLISGFLVMSFLHPESFSLAKLHLDARLASINTLVLITSGWLGAEA
jgi:nitric oxide reductase NorE protein